MDACELTVLLVSLGAILSPDKRRVHIENSEGVFRIDLETAELWVTPTMCLYCEAPCKAVKSICITVEGPGWSTCSLSHLQMEVLAKVIALIQTPLPQLIQDALPSRCPQVDIVRLAGGRGQVPQLIGLVQLYLAAVRWMDKEFIRLLFNPNPFEELMLNRFAGFEWYFDEET